MNKRLETWLIAHPRILATVFETRDFFELMWKVWHETKEERWTRVYFREIAYQVSGLSGWLMREKKWGDQERYRVEGIVDGEWLKTYITVRVMNAYDTESHERPDPRDIVTTRVT